MSKNNLLANVAIKRALTIGPRQQRKHKMQAGAGILGSAFNLGKSLLSPSILKKGFDICSTAINSEIRKKKKIDEGLNHAPDLYNYGTRKTKNLKKNWDQALQMMLQIKCKRELFNWLNV